MEHIEASERQTLYALPWACFTRLAVILFMLQAGGVVDAANHYVRPRATGANNGSNWTDAYTSLPSTLVRGDTYYLADGSYGAVTLGTAASGSLWIYLRKATIADHGTDTGWDNSYGDGVAEFTQLYITSAYWDIDGVTGSGDSPRGIKITTSSTETFGAVVIPFGNPNPGLKQFYRFRSLELTSSTTTSQGGFYMVGNTDVAGMSLDANPNVVVENCYIHHIGGLAGTGLNGSYQIWRNNYMEFLCRKDDSGHKEILKWDNTNSFIRVYNNVFKDWDGYNVTGGLILSGEGQSGTQRDWVIYNNVFWLSGNPPPPGANPVSAGTRVIGGLDSSSTDHADIHIYNNTFYNIQNTSGANVLPLFGVWTGQSFIYNNLFVDCPGLNAIGSVANSTKDYNAFYRTPNYTRRQPNDLSLVSNPLVNGPGGNFRLVTDAAVIGSALPRPSFFTTDFDGVKRGTTWTIGAFELKPSAPPSAPHSLLAIGQYPGDEDSAAPGVQVVNGKRYRLSGPNGSFMNWEWRYSIDDGPETVYLAGEGAILPADFTYPSDAVGRKYVWRLSVALPDGTLRTAFIITEVR